MYLQFEPGFYFAGPWLSSRMQVDIKAKSFRPIVMSARDEFAEPLEKYFGSECTVDEYSPGPAAIPGPKPVTQISVLTSFLLVEVT